MTVPYQIIESGPWFEAVKQLAAKVGIEAPRLVYYESPLINAFAGYDPLKNGQLVLSKGLCDAFGDKSLKRIPSNQLKAIMAHEMAHIKGGLQYIDRMRKAPIWAVPVAAIVGRHLFFSQPVHTTGEYLADITKDAAIGGAGLVAGGLISRQYVINHEFYADKVAAEAVSPKATKEALITLGESALRLQVKPKKGDYLVNFGMPNDSWLDRVISKYKHMTLHAHPDLKTRVKRLADMENTFAKPAIILAAETAETLGRMTETAIGIASKLR